MNPQIARLAIGASTAALLSVAASSAMAQTGSAPAYNCPLSEAKNTTCINGGGSTLAANVYTETTPALGIFTTVASNTGGTLGISYEKAGSGAGQEAFANNNPELFGNGDATDAFVVHFGASDAYITNTCPSPATPGCYLGAGNSLPNSVGGGPFIQIPMFATPITIPINNAKVTANGSGALAVKGSVALTDSDLCGIFSGLITQWGATSAGTKLKAGTIHVYWRDDNGGSGTTFLLTQHLAAVCTSSNTEPMFTFKATTKFATLFAGVNGASNNNPPAGSELWMINPGTGGYASNFIGGHGSNGVADGVLQDSTKSAIGYVSPDYTSIAKTPQISDISGDPTAYSNLLVADVKNASNGVIYAPDIADLLLAQENPGTSAVNPSPPALTKANAANAANQLNWVPQIALPAKGYPIVGYTNLLVAQCYAKKAVASGVKSMILQDLSPASKTFLNNNGFQPIAANNWPVVIKDAFILNVGGLNLDIQDATVCKNYTGR